MSILDIAGRAYDVGLQPWPVCHDGSKAPREDGWSKDALMGRLSREKTLEQFRNDDTGWGAITGKPSNNLEMLELEGRFVAEYGWDDFLGACYDASLTQIIDRVMEGCTGRSPSGGIHLPFHVDGEPLPNRKLASRPEGLTMVPLIETRGERGFWVCPGSNGLVHPNGGKWELIRGKLTTISTITAEERDLLYDIAGAFDEAPERRPPRIVVVAPGAGIGPESFADGVEDLQQYVIDEEGVDALLVEDGWKLVHTKRDGEELWRRPGKDRGHSASLFPDGGVSIYTSTIPERWSAVLLDGDFPFATPLGVLAAVRHEGRVDEAMSWIRRQLHAAAVTSVAPPPGVIIDVDDRDLSPADLLRRRMLNTDELGDIPLPESIVAGYLFRNSLAWIIGPSGVGKSFVAVDLALKVGTGGGWWHDNLVQGGKVLYVIAEGASGMSLRARAWRKFYGVDDTPQIDWLPVAVPLFDPKWAAALAEVVDGAGYDLIFVDTLARSSLGAEENSAKDTGIIIANLEEIRVRSGGACVVPIHHSGKDLSAGGRGSTAYKGAMESEIVVTGSVASVIKVEATKQKNVECPPALFFRATAVPLGGIGHNGEDLGSIVLVKATAEELQPVEDEDSISVRALRQRETVMRAMQRIAAVTSTNRLREELKKEPFKMNIGSENLKGILEALAGTGFVTSFKEGNATKWMLSTLGTEWKPSTS